MNILYWVILLVVVFIAYVWYKRRKHYKKLPLHQKLWEDYIRTEGSETAKKKLSDYLCGMLESAESSATLHTLTNGYQKSLLYYHRDRPFVFLEGVYGPFCTEEMKACIDKMEAKFAEARTEANKKSEASEAEKEAELLKAAQNALTWEDAATVLVGNYVGRASTNLAIQKMNRLSLFEVLGAKTLEELKTAKDRARTDSLARRYVPFMYEKIAKSMVEEADTIDTLIAAAELAPTEALACNTALYISFLKLEARRQQEKM